MDIPVVFLTALLYQQGYRFCCLICYEEDRALKYWYWEHKAEEHGYRTGHPVVPLLGY